MKRKNINLGADDKYGHWWFEMKGGGGKKESYGWWPKYEVGLVDTLLGTQGELNGVSTFNPRYPYRDPHHGDPADEEFHPTVEAGDTRTDAAIQKCLRDFARSYAKSHNGEWRWTFGAGPNCHTFQEEAMSHCKLSKS